jgi:hypothetical protein
MIIKVARLIVTLGLSVAFIVIGVTGCVHDQQSASLKESPPYTKPTWSGDDHDEPVYTSPAIPPASTNLSGANAHP